MSVSRWALFACIFAVAARNTALSMDRVIPTSNDSRRGDVIAIDAENVRFRDGAKLSLSDIRRIERLTRPRAEMPPCRLYLADGSQFAARSVEISEDVCRIQWRGERDWKLPIDAVRGVRFALIGDARAEAAFRAALADSGNARDDRLIALNAGQPQIVRGALESCSGERVEFSRVDDARDQPLEVPMDRVVGIVFAATAGPDKSLNWKTTTLTDGSRFACRELLLSDGNLRVVLAAGPTALLPWSEVAQVSFPQPRVQYLSDLEPTEVEELPLVTFARAFQKDRAATGGPLRIGVAGANPTTDRDATAVFEKGLGAHAVSKLVYELTGDAHFFATIGIDRSSREGDCEFVVRGDDEELFRRRMRWNDEAVDISIDLHGRRRLSLVVEAGEQLDLGDIADWCDARLVLTTTK